MASVDRAVFQAEVDRLFAAFGRPSAKRESLSAWYAELPHRIGPMQLGVAVTTIIREHDTCPQNLVRAITQAVPAAPRRDETAPSDVSPEEAARNRNRVNALLRLNAQKAGDELRDTLVAHEGAALLKAGELDWRDGFSQRRYRTVISVMEQAHDSLTTTQICREIERVLDESIAAGGAGGDDSARSAADPF